MENILRKFFFKIKFLFKNKGRLNIIVGKKKEASEVADTENFH